MGEFTGYWSLVTEFSCTAAFMCTNANNVERCITITDIPFQNILSKRTSESEVRSRKSKVRSAKSEVGSRKSEF